MKRDRVKTKDRDWQSHEAVSRDATPAFEPYTDTPVGAEVCVPSNRGRETVDVTHGQNVASPLQGRARWSAVAAIMHSKNASAIDLERAKAEAKRAARKEERRAKFAKGRAA